MKNKKGLSPVIATVLLIAIVVILALIIFLWARGFVAEKAQKGGRAVDLSCGSVDFEAGIYELNTLDIVNRGDIPLYGFIIKKVDLELGSIEIKTDIQGSTVGVGDSVEIPLGNAGISSGDELLVVPIILGEIDSGKVAHTCGDNDGYTVYV